MTDREMIRVWISADAKAQLEGLQSRTGTSQTELLTRIISAVAGMNRLAQLELLGIINEEDLAGRRLPESMRPKPAGVHGEAASIKQR